MKALCDNCKREYESEKITCSEDFEQKCELLCDECQEDREL